MAAQTIAETARSPKRVTGGGHFTATGEVEVEEEEEEKKEKDQIGETRNTKGSERGRREE